VDLLARALFVMGLPPDQMHKLNRKRAETMLHNKLLLHVARQVAAGMTLDHARVLLRECFKGW